MVVLNLAFVNFSQSIVPTECVEAYSPFKLFLIQIVSSAQEQHFQLIKYLDYYYEALGFI